MAVSTLLTKQAVAHRLILSAVQLIEQDHDPLATHCIAACASNLLRELVAGKGQNYGSRVFGVALFEMAQAQIEARKPIAGLPSHPEIDRAVTAVRRGIEGGFITSPLDVDVSMPKGVERQVMQNIIAPFNFMKHADKDPADFLSEDELQPIQATCHAIAAYALLFPNVTLPDDVLSFIDVHMSE